MFGSWEQAVAKHKGNFIRIVTKRWQLFNWIHQLLPSPLPPKEQCGFRISIAEMHRTMMRALQIELINIGIALQFDNHNLETMRKLERVLTKYSME